MKNVFAYFFIFFISIGYAQVSDFNTVNFTRADNIAKLNEGYSLENLPLLAHNLTYNLPTDVEKFRAIYTWVCNNIKSDIRQDDIVTNKRNKLKNDSIAYIKWNNEYKKIAFKKLLKHKKTMCTGYAYLIKELCFLANIECKIIDGYGRTVNSNVDALVMANHSWNAVKLNNKWYLCDATWSSGYSSNRIFIKDYNDGYFLTDPILFAKNHYPLDKKWLLYNTITEMDFVTSPLVYGETFEHKIIPISPQQMSVKTKINSEIDFSFKTLKETDNNTISLVYYLGTKEYAFSIYDVKNENGFVEFKNKFTKKGSYDVHLKIGNDVVATYTIMITKS